MRGLSGRHPKTSITPDWPATPRFERTVTVPPLLGVRADCCGAPAGVRIRLGVGHEATGATELLFCEHHYRAHRAALAGADATAFDADGEPLVIRSGTLHCSAASPG